MQELRLSAWVSKTAKISLRQRKKGTSPVMMCPYAILRLDFCINCEQDHILLWTNGDSPLMSVLSPIIFFLILMRSPFVVFKPFKTFSSLIYQYNKSYHVLILQELPILYEPDFLDWVFQLMGINIPSYFKSQNRPIKTMFWSMGYWLLHLKVNSPTLSLSSRTIKSQINEHVSLASPQLHC